MRTLLERAEASIRGRRPARDGQFLPWSELCASVEHSTLTSRLAAALATLLAAPRDAADTVDAGQVRSLVQDALALERDEQLSLYEQVRNEMADAADPVAAVETELTSGRLDQYFARQAAADNPGRVVELNASPAATPRIRGGCVSRTGCGDIAI